MANRRLSLFLLVPLAVGCHSTPKHPPVPVVVLDAETKQPVPGASVRLWSPNPRAGELGTGADQATGADGVAHLRNGGAEDLGLVVAVSAPGYLPEETDFRPLSDGTVVEVFRGPRPVVELVVPNGFRGVVKAEVHIADGPPGERSFSVPVSAAGVAQVVGPPVLTQGPGPEFRGRYADGTALPSNVEGLQVGLRWLRCEGNDQFFVVGTEAEWNAARRSMAQDYPPQRGGGGRGPGGAGGRGGGGRRGGGGGRGGGGSGAPAGVAG